MIFLTVGTQGPFERLVRAVDMWCASSPAGPRVFGQIASPAAGSYVPKNFEWVARLAPEQFNARFSAADLIISHAGMGTIISALQAGKQIVVMPRRAHLMEHRNDHQLATVKQMAGRAGLHVAADEDSFAQTAERALSLASGESTPQIPEFADTGLTAALRDFILAVDR